MHVHFVGIGGIGVSALAQYYISKGHKVSGSDLNSSEITRSLEKKGAEIFIGKQKKENVPQETGLLVYTPAVGEEHPEIKAAKDLGIKIRSYPQALGDLTKKHFTIAVTGTHGKSTTTSMLGLLLEKAGLDPTVIVGTKLKEFGDSNFRMGKSNYLVIEACEHLESFLNYWPKIIVLTTIEADHLDFYQNMDRLLEGFKKFISHLPEDGILVANKDDQNITRVLEKTGFNKKIIYFSLKDQESKRIKNVLSVPGEFNVSNALACLKVARILNIPDNVSFDSLSEYKGSWRRFDVQKANIKGNKIILVDDYGHHPTEVRVTLEAAREKFPDEKILCIFQPHQYQRTYYLSEGFIKTFKHLPIDKLVVTDIYSVPGREREELKKKINSQKLVQKADNPSVVCVPKERLENYLEKNLKQYQVLLIMGAGDIYDFSLKIREA